MLHSTALKLLKRIRKQGLLSFYLHSAVLKWVVQMVTNAGIWNSNAHDLFGITQ